MQKQEKSRKPLIIGVIAAVVILAVVLALLLTQCVGGGTGATTDPSATAGSSTEVPTYELYWNADRAEYAGKSEAGMSSRMPESDGYFHVRFILDGEEVVLKVADRKLINAIDVKDLMGLEFDENGIVIGVTDIEDMPLEKLGWQFYVQSAAKTLIKLNSSEGMNGMEVLLETDENTGVYDMTGLSGPLGATADPINMDRVYAVANLAGEVTHVFIYQRPNYMLTHEAECEHCKKTVTWYEWTKTDSLPLTTGHYQLQNDIQLNGQPAQQEDAKVCLDLNGKRVDGKSGSRCYAMFNAGTELAIMDTSEGQTGVMAAHGKGDQGMVVWVRYGAFYLYGGTLDASDAITKLNGTAVECGNGKYFYMYGGTIIGGKAEPQKNDKGNWTNGLGGTMSIGGKFVMNGGEIRDGYAESKVTWKNGEPTYNRGFGGNIYAGSTAVIELNGGVIKNGRAGNTGGNIYMDGSAELTINGGKIQGGTITGKGRNGGSIFAGAKTKIVLSGGSISGGTCRNCGGNIYTNGVLTMTGGSIYGGTIRNYTTGKVTENAPSANIFVVNGRFHMYGGKIDGGVQLIDTSATDNKDTYCYLTTHAVIDGGSFNTRSLTLTNGGSGITVSVGKMRDDARVGVHATTGIFTLPTLEENKDNFFSSIEGADIVYHDGCLGLGRVQCVCGKDAHFGACDGTTYVFAPWESKSTLPNGTGKYYLLNDVKMTGTTSVVTQGDGVDVEIVLDLNGKNVKKAGGSSRVYSLFENKVSKNPDGTYAGNIEGEGVHVTLTDSAGTAVVDLNTVEDGDQGLLLWGRYNDSKINIYGGTYVGTNVNSKRHSGVIITTAGELNIYGGTFDGGNSTSAGGIISVSGSKAVFNLYGGVIKNGTATHSGGNINVASGATMNMYGGTVTAGSVNKDGTLVGDLGYGGNIVVSGTLNMYGGEITDGLVKIGLAGQKADGTKISAGGGLAGNLQVNGTANLMGGVIRDGNAGTGGNIGTNNTNATIILDGVQVLDGVSTGSGGNIAINVRAAKLLEIKGNTLVSGGTAAAAGGNIYANAWAANSKDINISIAGGTIENGTATTKGGNVYMHNTTSGDTAGKNVITMTGGTISGGKLTNTANNGGSIYLESKSEFVMNGGTVTGGSGAKQGGNFYLANSTGKLTVNGGEILNGYTNDCGGNVQLQGGSTLVVNGGKILDGHHNNGGSNSSHNVYAVSSHVVMTGGEINGLAVTNTKANGCTVKISGDAVVSPSKSGAGLSLGVYPASAAFDTPFIELGELSDKASILMSTGGYVSTKTIQANVNNFTTNVADAGAHFVDERVFIGQVACICGGTSNIGPCAEGGHKTVAWTPWDGARDTMKADTHYYLTKDVTVSTQITLGNDGRPSNVSVNLNGHTMTTSFRVFQMWNSSTMNLADHKGGGAILTKGNTGDNFGGIQMLNTPTVHMYSGKIGFAEGYKNHKAVALIEAAGTFNMYGGEIFGGKNPTATLVRVSGTFNMYGGTVRDGYNATISTDDQRGGNFRVGGTLNVYGGTITGGKAKYGGNIAATGKVNVYGGTISDGHGYTGETTNYPQGGNIWLTGASAALNVNGKATISGGQLTGSSWMPGGSIYANSKAAVTIDGGATVTGGDGQDGNNIYLTSDGTTLTLKDCTIENTVDGSGNIMVERGNVIIDGATIINKANGYNLRANETGKVANFTLNSGLVTGGKPNVTLGGDDTFTMNGGTIENGSGTNGGNIVLGNSKFTLKNGTITGGVASKAGGNFALSGASQLVIDGGEIMNGKANGGTGGNIVLWDTSTVTLNKGTVSGGTSSGNGGNISVDAKNVLTINGGQVVNGVSGDSGGNIVAYGKVVMTNGEVLNGRSANAGNGMNISIVKSADGQASTLEITGGKIGGGLHFNNYTGDVTVSISGSPVIDKALSTEVTPTYSMKLDKNDLNIGQLTDGAKIVVSGKEGVFSYKAPEGSAQYFHSEVEGLNVFQTPADELVLVYGKTGCICGSTDGNHIGDCDGTPHDWMPVTSLPTTSGYYYLISDVTDSGDQRILTTSQDIYLDLNGKTVTSNKWRMYRFDVGCNLTITDNSANRDGKIVVPANRDQGAVVWFFGGNSTFSMYGGTIDVSAAKNNSGSPGLAVAGGGSVVKLFAGKILGGTYDPVTNWGGAVAFEGGKVHYMGNMEITGTDSVIFVGNGSILDMSNVTEAPETPWSVNASGVFTKGWNKNWDIADYFTPGTSTGAQIYLDETTGELKMGVMDCTCRQATCICDGKDILWQPWFSAKDLPTATGNWYLTRDVSGVGQKGIISATFTDVKVDLAGHRVTANKGSRVYLVQNSNHLTITDSVGGGVVAGGGSNNNNCGGFLMQGTTVLKLYAGTLTLSETAYTNNTRGGVIEINGSFYMYGGEVTGGTAKAGGNIWSDSSSDIHILGGKVTNGTALYSGTETTYAKGGNIFVSGASSILEIDGKAEISGGVVTTTVNGKAGWAPGGNIYADSGAQVTINGGTIKNGKASDGHNIYLTSAATTVTLKNVTVENTSTGSSNIVVEAGTLNVEDGALIKNTVAGARNIATNNSAGCVAIINIKGGTVTGGHITGGSNGGNIIINADDSMTVSGGVIENGVSENQAGNISIHGTVTISGGTIRNGKAKTDGDGHNICVTSPSADKKANLEISGGNIAGGIVFNCFYTTPNVKISGKPVIDKALTSADAAAKPGFGISVPASFDLDVAGLTGGEIHVKGSEAGQFAVNATSGMEKYFVSETVLNGVTLPVCYENGGLCFGQVYCLCGYTKDGTTKTAHEYWCDQVQHIWLPWNGMSTTVSGYYYLPGDMTQGQVEIGNGASTDVVIDLNGHTLSSNTRAFRVMTGSLGVTDTVGGGKVLGGGVDTQSGVLLLSNGVTINLYAGTWTLKDGKSAGDNGGIMDIGTGTVVNMYSGTLTGGTALKQGGNVSMAGGTFNFYGGTITGGKASQGGNVRVSSGQFNMIPSALDTKGEATRTISGGIATVTGGYGKGGNIYATGSNSKVTVSGTKSEISGGQVISLTAENASQWSPGGNIEVEGSAQLTVSDGATVKGGTGTQGNNFYMTGNSSKITLDGAIVDNTTAKAENIYIEGGTLDVKGTTQIKTVNGARNINTNDNGKPVINIFGGTITGATYGGVGANINLSSAAVFNMSDGTITGGYANGSGNNGGSIYNGGTFNLSGGEIIGGQAANCGGNIANYGTLTISNGKVYGGKSGSNVHANIYSQGNITISGGQVYGGLTMHNLGKANLTVSAGAVIDGKLNATAIPGVTFWNYGDNPYKPLTISGKLTGTACIGINMTDWAFANAGDYTADSIKAFYAYNDSMGIYLLDSTDSQAGMLYVGQYNCICGGTATEGACAEGGHQKVRWTAWNGTSALNANGNYYLTANATVSSQITLAKDTRPTNVSVNLNGNTLTAGFRMFQLWDTAEGTLNLADHKGGGKILAKGVKDNFGIAQIVNGTHTINLYSGTYRLTTDHASEASVSLFGIYGTNSVMNVYNATIEGDTEKITGTLIEIGAGGTVNLFSGATVKNGYDDRHGGNFRISGTLNIKGGTVEGGKATVEGGGGNIYITGTGVVNLSSGTVKNGFGTKQGGNFRIDGSATLNVTGGTIENGLSADCGGNIYANGLVKMSGGTITGGKKAASATEAGTALNNSNIYLVDGDLTMSGGTIDGLNACNTTENGCIINISGKANITNADGFGMSLINYAAAGTTPPEAPVINLGALDASASICVSGQLERVFATGTGATVANKARFSSNDGYKVICTEDGLMMVDADAHAHCVCGGELAEDDTHTCYDIIYTKMTDSDYKFYSDTDKNAVFRGNYYLTDDLDMLDNSINLRHDAQINICLNGHTLTSTTRTVAMFCDGSDGNNCKHTGVTEFVATPVLNIASCEDGGVVASRNTNSENGRVLWARYGDINCYGITIDASKSTKNNGTSHTGIALQTNTGDATLYNCVVKGGIDNSLSTNSQFGAAMSVSSTSGKLYLVGSFDLQTADKAIGLYIVDGGKIDVSGLESVTKPISVSASGVFTEGGKKTALKMEEIFTSFVSGMDVFTSVNTMADEAFFGKVSCLCGSTTEDHLGECTGSRLELAAWRVKNALPKATGNYILTPGNFTTPRNTPNNGAKIVVNLNGQTITGSDRIYTPQYIEDNNSYQCKSATVDIINGKMISCTSGTQGGVFWLGNGTKVSLYNVTVDARGRSASGKGTVADTAAGSIFNMFGNTTLYGGTTAASGGTMSINGQLNMWDDSKIIGGTTTQASNGDNTVGGALYIGSTAAVVTMNDNATIQDGVAQNNGGNVYISSGKLIMNDNAQILNGKAGNISGNIQVSSGHTLEMNGGKISGGISYYGKSNENAAAIHANATILNNGVLKMTGGEITGYVNAFAYTAGASPKITVSGTAKISGGTNNLNMSIDKGDLFSITVGEGGLKTGADIQITTNDDLFVSGVTLVTNVAPTDVGHIGASVPYLYDNTEKIIFVK